MRERKNVCKLGRWMGKVDGGSDGGGGGGGGGEWWWWWVVTIM